MSAIRPRNVAVILSLVLLVTACQPMTGPRMPPLKLRYNTPVPPTATPLPSPTATLWMPTPRPKPEATPDIKVTATLDAASAEWLERAGLGPNAPANEDWKAIPQLAQVEGSVVIYADSARLLSAAESFMESVPGLRAEAFASDSYDLAMRLPDEATAPEADLYLANDPPRIFRAMAQRQLWSYLPQDLAAAFPQGMREPLPTHHWTALMVIYNNVLSSTVPISNWWDLTRAEWRGRVSLPDPIDDEQLLYLMVTMSQHAPEMARAYRAAFGRDLVLDDDCADAGYQWIKALLTNQPKLLPGDAEVARLVGDPNARQLWLGLCSYAEYARVSRGELNFVPMPDLQPIAGLRLRTYLAIVDRAPHPNAAKLMVRWLFGDAAGAQGFRPWYEPGIYPARSDVPDPQGALSRQTLDPRLWEIDPVYVSEHLQAVRDHIAKYIGHPVGGRAE